MGISAMHPAFETDAQIRAYLDHKITLTELRDWYRVSAGALMALAPDTKVSDLATALQLALVEYDQGGFSERQVRRHLRAALNQTTEIVVHAAVELTTSENSTQSIIGNAIEAGPSETIILEHQLIPTGTTS